MTPPAVAALSLVSVLAMVLAAGPIYRRWVSPRFKQPAADAPGQRVLGPYRIGQELGRGSMGTVYLGHDLRTGISVAIKTMALSREFAEPELAEARAQFLREAESVRGLRHPDIVAIVDAGEADGMDFIAMEFVPGSSLLAHVLPATLLPVATVLRIAQRVALALAHAHRHGVVHRDIKPGNVLINAATGVVKVLDFGIASVVNAGRTRTGMLLGTPSFMSPEQLAGGSVDGRTDLYALGVMLFQLLTGALPHRADSMARLMYQIANEAAPDLRSLRPELPEALAKLVAVALQKRPELRQADGRQMADQLGNLILLMQQAPEAALRTPSTALDGTTPDVTGADVAASVNFKSETDGTRADPRHNSVL